MILDSNTYIHGCQSSASSDGIAIIQILALSLLDKSPLVSSQEIRISIENVLAPIARFSLRQGITAHEFTRLAEAAFVRAAIDVLNEQGKNPSFSRISAATGIHRHAVSEMLGGTAGARGTAGTEKEYQRHRLARVLTGWFESPDFTDSNGRPKPLKPDGERPSFAELVREFSGDIYPGIILDELIHAGAVRVREDGLIEALSRRFTSVGADDVAMQHACIVAGDVLRTVEHNVRAVSEDRFYEDSAIALEFPPAAIPRLARMLEQRATAFLDDFEGWLSEVQQETAAASETGEAVRAGVRVVMVAGNATGHAPADKNVAQQDTPED